MTENTSHSNIRERSFIISPSQVKFLAGNLFPNFGVLTRNVNIGDTEIWVQDRRFTPEEFMQRFDLYANLDISRHTAFYPSTKVLVQSGIRQLLSEIINYGMTECQQEIYDLLLREERKVINNIQPLTLDDLKKEINKILKQDF